MENIIGPVITFVMGLGIMKLLLPKVSSVLKESGELLTEVAVALEDEKITTAEVVSIFKESKDVYEAVKKVKK